MINIKKWVIIIRFLWSSLSRKFSERMLFWNYVIDKKCQFCTVFLLLRNQNKNYEQSHQMSKMSM